MILTNLAPLKKKFKGAAFTWHDWFKGLEEEPPKILIFDIETMLMLAGVFGLGEQSVRHTQLVSPHNRPRIICISYCINDGPLKTIKFDYETQDDSKVIEEFDKIVKSCDIVIGKNSQRFDVKMINAVRFLQGLPAFPDWADVSDDLELQMRKYFRFPSQSLDYISSQLGLGGKMKMEYNDWLHILLKTPKLGPRAFKKMTTYCPNDVFDTRLILILMMPYIKWKFNMSNFVGGLACISCGSTNIHANGTRLAGKTRYQHFHCKDHGGYAGKRPINSKGILG